MQHLADRSDYHATFLAFTVHAAESPGIAASSKSFHAFAALLLSLLCQRGGAASDVELLTHAARSDAVPAHFRLLFVIALVAVAGARPHRASDGGNCTAPPSRCDLDAGSARASHASCSGGSVDGDDADATRASEQDSLQPPDTQAVCDAMHGVLAYTCGRGCMHADVLSDVLVDTCTAGGTAAAPLQRALLRYSHRHLFNSHCTGISKQRLELAPLGRPVVFGQSADREMFVARLRMPRGDAAAAETEATPSGWWLKVERCCGSKSVNETTYSIFLNNRRASEAAPLQAAFEIGVVASTDQAMRKAEAAAVLIEHSGFMRPGLWAPHEASIHRSAIRQEFSGTAWGIRHLFNDIALAKFGCAGEGAVACVFGMVQTS